MHTPPARPVTHTPSLAVHEAAARARLQVFALEPPASTRIDVARSRAEFEARTGVTDPLVRAWTSFDVITLAPLSSWSDTSPEAITARLTHELCHAAIEQRFGAAERARAARIPRFFEEGACSVAADQGAQRLALDEVRARATVATLTPDAFARDAVLAYAAAHHLMAAVRARHGDGVFARVADEAAADGSAGAVERALERVMGTSIEQAWVSFVAAPGAAAALAGGAT